MRKISLSLFVSTALALLLVVPVMAASSPQSNHDHFKVLKKNIEIKDQRVLIERAKNNVSDLPVGDQVSTEKVYSTDKEKSLDATKYTTAQLITEEQNTTTGDIISTYALSTLTSYDASKYNSGWDQSMRRVYNDGGAL